MMNYSNKNSNINMLNQTIKEFFEEEEMDNYHDLTNGTQPSFLDRKITKTWAVDFENSTRFWVHCVLIPIVVTSGITGNIVTTYILRRKQMQTPSNMYLTSLAFADILFLAFSYSMSWKHYGCVKDEWLYWQYVPFGLWITAAFNSTSVWLTVSFTIERYIAVCHPLAGRVNCIGQRAKYVSCAVCIMSFLLTSIPLEWKFVPKLILEEDSFKNLTTNTTEYNPQNTDHDTNSIYQLFFHWFIIIFVFLVPLFIMAIMNVLLIHAVQNSRRNRESLTNSRLQNQQVDRISITLILAVVVFLICQLPRALLLIYTSLNNPAKSGSVEENIVLGLENVCQLLVNINVACNFLLYTALCDRFRRAFVTVLLSKYPIRPEIPLHAV